jgi:hypothetical protein
LEITVGANVGLYEVDVGDFVGVSEIGCSVGAFVGDDVSPVGLEDGCCVQSGWCGLTVGDNVCLVGVLVGVLVLGALVGIVVGDFDLVGESVGAQVVLKSVGENVGSVVIFVGVIEGAVVVAVGDFVGLVEVG